MKLFRTLFYVVLSLLMSLCSSVHASINPLWELVLTSNDPNLNNAQIYFVNVATGGVGSTVVSSITTIGPTISPDATTAYYTGDPTSFFTISVPTGIVGPSASGPFGLPALSPDGSTCYVLQQSPPTLFSVNTSTFSSTSTTTGLTNPSCIAVSTDGSKIYIGNNSVVLIYDAATLTLDPQSPITGFGGTPLFINVTPDGNTLVIVNNNKTMYTYATATNTLVHTIPLPPSATGNF